MFSSKKSLRMYSPKYQPVLWIKTSWSPARLKIVFIEGEKYQLCTVYWTARSPRERQEHKTNKRKIHFIDKIVILTRKHLQTEFFWPIHNETTMQGNNHLLRQISADVKVDVLLQFSKSGWSRDCHVERQSDANIILKYFRLQLASRQSVHTQNAHIFSLSLSI